MQLSRVDRRRVAVALQPLRDELLDVLLRQMGEDGTPGRGGVQRRGVADGVGRPYGVAAVHAVHVPVPFYNGTPWFLPFGDAYYRAKDRLR
ncbi:hypothetical protein QFZ43_000601 [Streptomyces afghaniensis]|nr:hypothetical protein [Streptomyces afghaniensis]